MVETLIGIVGDSNKGVRGGRQVTRHKQKAVDSGNGGDRRRKKLAGGASQKAGGRAAASSSKVVNPEDVIPMADEEFEEF
jgi:hypothetical protein